MRKIRWKKESNDHYTFEKNIPVIGCIFGEIYAEKTISIKTGKVTNTKYTLSLDNLETDQILFPDDFVDIETLNEAKRMAEKEIEKLLFSTLEKIQKYIDEK